MKWMRTCQSCGAKRQYNPPNPKKELGVNFTERKCKVCKSESLDYGFDEDLRDPEWYKEEE